jgi:hypothetical protein
MLSRSIVWIRDELCMNRGRPRGIWIRCSLDLLLLIWVQRQDELWLQLGRWK